MDSLIDNVKMQNSQVQFTYYACLSAWTGLMSPSDEWVRYEPPPLFPGLVSLYNITLLRTILDNLGPLARYSVSDLPSQQQELSAVV